MTENQGAAVAPLIEAFNYTDEPSRGARERCGGLRGEAAMNRLSLAPSAERRAPPPPMQVLSVPRKVGCAAATGSEITVMQTADAVACAHRAVCRAHRRQPRQLRFDLYGRIAEICAAAARRARERRVHHGLQAKPRPEVAEHDGRQNETQYHVDHDAGAECVQRRATHADKVANPGGQANAEEGKCERPGPQSL